MFGETTTPASQIPSEKISDKIPACKKTRLMESQVQVIKEIGMSLTRTTPTEWNEFMTVAMGIADDEPLPFLTEPATQEEHHPPQLEDRGTGVTD